MTIDINFDATPDEMPVVSEGVHTFEVIDVEEKTDKNQDPYQAVSLKVVEPGEEDHDRRQWERFNFKYDIARILFKKFVKACGFDTTGQAGVDPGDLIGCTFEGRIVHKIEEDPDDPEETITRANIRKYICGGVEV